ncbi:hypothetical protein, partial [Paraburkholderia caribensis]|uniref:hypothetical protein n=1 Tax=Paraburkholderia caribensis TaxID=75105 RepID=UPI001CC79C07
PFAEIPLLFFAAAKKSRCRPAQGQRLQTKCITRMPPKEQTADASENQKQTKTKNQKKLTTHAGPQPPGPSANTHT